MWAVFTYIYNSILIIFIAIHLLVGALITFCVGVYIGIYLSQNYQIPRIDEPFKLWSYFVKFIEERRKPGGMSIFPSTNKKENEDRKNKKEVNEVKDKVSDKEGKVSDKEGKVSDKEGKVNDKDTASVGGGSSEKIKDDFSNPNSNSNSNSNISQEFGCNKYELNNTE